MARKGAGIFWRAVRFRDTYSISTRKPPLLFSESSSLPSQPSLARVDRRLPARTTCYAEFPASYSSRMNICCRNSCSLRTGACQSVCFKAKNGKGVGAVHEPEQAGNDPRRTRSARELNRLILNHDLPRLRLSLSKQPESIQITRTWDRHDSGPPSALQVCAQPLGKRCRSSRPERLCDRSAIASS